MTLKTLELQGFKTFPEKTLLHFEQGVTSVVGPNGSGKSNISDAIRWVLGEQSVRTLRCSRMEDVIFSGTPLRRAMGYAEVTLTIDNADRGLPFDSDEVAVTRRYYRSGESEYLINRNVVRLKDINELFMDTGLGRDGYSIIGQGKIDSIVAARSEDRREIFEEAAGISRYRYRKEESERRLNRTEENLVRLRDILGELEDRVEPLRLQAEKAEKFLAYDAEKKSLEIGIWLETLNRSGSVLREQEEKIGIARAQQEDCAQRLEEIAARTEENFREMGACTARMEEARGQAEALEQQALRVEGETGVLRSEIEHGERDEARLRGEMESARQSDEATDREIAGKCAEAEEKERQIAESRKRLLGYTQRLEELRQTADEATRKLEEAALQEAQRNADLSEERVRLSAAQSSLGEIRLRAEAVEEAVKQAEERQAAARQEGEELAGMLADSLEKLHAEENAIAGYELRLENRRRRAETAKAQLDKLRLDVSEQLRRAGLLEDLERNLEGFAQSVKAVMKESQRGGLAGICGPVSRILRTPAEYAVAMETALGGAMQNIVVETEQDAKSAIRLLQQRDLGRATFLPVSTIHGTVLDEKELEELPGYVGVAARLVSCQSKYDGIKASLLGRVAVAEDLDSAVAIARRTGYRFRVVSLDGQVVNAGGSLTGGSKGRNSGLLSRAAEIERIKKKAGELQKQADQAQADHRERQVELSAAEAELEAARGELAALQEERIRVEAEAGRAARELEQIGREAEDLRLERQDSAGRMRELEQQERTAQERIAELERTLEAAREESQALQGRREEQMTRVTDISQTVQELRMSEYAAQTDRDNLLAAVAQLEERKGSAAAVQEQLERELSALAQARRELEHRMEEYAAQAADYRAQAEETRRDAARLAQHRTELEQEAARLRAREREETQERERIGQELARLQERSDNLQKEYDSILTRLWEDYELTRREAEEQAQPIEDLPGAQKRLTELRGRIKALGTVNVGAVVEYQEVHERYEFLQAQVTDVEQSKAELLKLIEELTRSMREQFAQRFVEIDRHFGTIFRELFGGGAAKLSFSDEQDVLNSGIEIQVHPPGKIVTHIESLSGGEKALVAISIYFAIMRVNPPPFCVLDEIDAALDDVNVTRYAQYLRRMSGRSQCISITHRRGTMEGSDMLYGVTMQDEGVSKLLALKTDEAAGFSGAN